MTPLNSRAAQPEPVWMGNQCLPGFEPGEADPMASSTGSKATGTRHWLAVACAEHVRRGRSEGFMQVCHGKAAPLRRLRPGDRVVYYSPSLRMGGRDALQAFTALGVVLARPPYVFDMGGGFTPFRRDVAWCSARETPITPLLQALEFSAGKKHWGYPLRLGLLEISAHDMAVIAQAMAASLAED